MSKRNVKLKYKDLLAIKHSLMASVSAKKKMIVDFEGKPGAVRIPQLLKDVEHEESLAAYLTNEAHLMVAPK